MNLPVSGDIRAAAGLIKQLKLASDLSKNNPQLTGRKSFNTIFRQLKTLE